MCRLRKMIIVQSFHLYLAFSILVYTTHGVPVSETNAIKRCDLTVWHGGTDVTNSTMSVLDGDIVRLVCDARCSVSHYPPNLKWFDPQFILVKDIPRLRTMSSPLTSQRLQTLYIQGFSGNDRGRYTCRGYIGYRATAHVTIAFETQNQEFRDLRPR